MRTYGIGVLGLGEGRSIISAALQSARWNLVSVCDVNEDLCRKRATEFGLSHWTTSYERMLATDEIEVVAIYTPDQLHGRHIIQAVEAGKHVVCTKPLLASLDEASSVRTAVRASGKQLFVGQSSRFFEPMMRQRRDFDLRRHGDLTVVEASYVTDARWFLDRPWSRQSGFSWMYNFLIHPIDLVRWYAPDIVSVFGYGKASSEGGSRTTAPDAMRFVAIAEDGVVAQIAGSYVGPVLGKSVEPSIVCTLRGTSGVSRAGYPTLAYHTRFGGEPERTERYDHLAPYYFRFEHESHHAGEYQNYIDYFAECLDSGVHALPDLDEGLETLALLRAMEISLAERRPVDPRVVAAEYGLT